MSDLYFFVDSIFVVTFGIVDVVIKETTAFFSLFVECIDALSSHVCKVKPAHVDGPTAGGVLESLGSVGKSFPVE